MDSLEYLYDMRLFFELFAVIVSLLLMLSYLRWYRIIIINKEYKKSQSIFKDWKDNILNKYGYALEWIAFVIILTAWYYAGNALFLLTAVIYFTLLSFFSEKLIINVDLLMLCDNYEDSSITLAKFKFQFKWKTILYVIGFFLTFLGAISKLII